jgi:hypothetical protein
MQLFIMHQPSIPQKFFRFLASLWLCVILILIGSAIFAVVTQSLKCRDSDYNGKHVTACKRYGIDVAQSQGSIYKSATDQFSGIALSLYTSFTQLVSTFLAKKIESPSSKSQQVLFLIGREVFIALAMIYCTTVLIDVAGGSPAFGYNKDWVKDQSQVTIRASICEQTRDISPLGPHVGSHHRNCNRHHISNQWIPVQVHLRPGMSMMTAPLNPTQIIDKSHRLLNFQLRRV